MAGARTRDEDAAEAAMDETAREDAELAAREAEQEEQRLAAEHSAAGHTAYVPGCPECAADFDTPPDPEPGEELGEDEVAQPATTPYERLVAHLSAPTRCQHCGRTDPLTPAGVADAVGLSESAVRRLMSADVAPSMRAVTTMAAALNVSTVKLLEELWPALAQPQA